MSFERAVPAPHAGEAVGQQPACRAALDRALQITSCARRHGAPPSSAIGARRRPPHDRRVAGEGPATRARFRALRCFTHHGPNDPLRKNGAGSRRSSRCGRSSSRSAAQPPPRPSATTWPSHSSQGARGRDALYDSDPDDGERETHMTRRPLRCAPPSRGVTGVRGRRAPRWRAGGSCSSTTTSRRSVRLRKVAGDLVAVDDRSLPRAVVEPDERTSTASAPVTPLRRGRMWHYILTMPQRMRRWRSKRSANVKDSNCAEDPILLAHVPAVLMQAVGGLECARLRARRYRAEGDRPRPASPAATTSRERAATSCRETRHARCGLPE